MNEFLKKFTADEDDPRDPRRQNEASADTAWDGTIHADTFKARFSDFERRQAIKEFARRASACAFDWEPPRIPYWAAEPDVVRVVHGVADGRNRIAALGDGQVPAVAAAAWRILSGR